MPTGYTCGVQDGEVTELKDYVLVCARQFGAFMHMRDDNINTKPKLREVSDYHLKRLEEAKDKLSNYQVQSREDFEKEMQEWFIKSNKERAEYRESCKLKRERYTNMLDKVKAWEIPTEEHRKLKEFCIEQLKGSIDFDCNENSSYAKPLTVDDIPKYDKYVDDKLKGILRDIEYHTKNYREEIEKVEECNKWITDLYKSLEE